MPIRSFIYLLWVALAECKGRVLAAIGVVAVTVAVVTVSLSFGFGFLYGAIQKAEALFPRSTIVVKPRSVDLMMFRFNAGALSDDVVEQLQKLEGVSTVARQLSLKMPLRAVGEILGHQVTTDAVVVGIDEAFVAKDLHQPQVFHYDPLSTTPIPCVVPRFFLEMYNLAYADSMGLPKINEAFALGKTFTLILGETYLLGGGDGSDGKHGELPCRVVGFTDNPLLLAGVLIPLNHAKVLNDWYRGNQPSAYTSLYVDVGELDKIEQVTSAIQSLGFTIESQRETVEKFLFVARSAIAAIFLFTALLVAIASLSVVHTVALSLYQRRGEFGLMRALGITKHHLMALLIGEAAFTALVGGAIGIGSVFLLVRELEIATAAWLPRSTIIPQQVFLLDWRVALGALSVGLLVSVGAVLPLFWRVVSSPPVHMLAATG